MRWRRDVFGVGQPHDLPPQAAKAGLETKMVLRKAIATNRALAELKSGEI